MKILIFAGTTEGRLFSMKCVEKGFDVTISVATEYGKEIINEIITENLSSFDNKNIRILQNRLSLCEMESLFVDFDCVVDATHPFAVEVTKNIKAACEKCEKKYFRLLRTNLDCEKNALFEDSDFFEFDSLSELAVSLTKFVVDSDKKGEKQKIFISTGSKELECFTKIPEFYERCFVRVLPVVDSIQKCLDAGFKTKNIIAMQGPFSLQMNEALFLETKTQILVTKQSGKNGGFDEKILAAKNCGMKIFSVKPPEENGENIFSDMEKLLAVLCEEVE